MLHSIAVWYFDGPGWIVVSLLGVFVLGPGVARSNRPFISLVVVVGLMVLLLTVLSRFR